jgi:ABC-type polysaccharide/polyol phosphate transport system ATPase subunit
MLARLCDRAFLMSDGEITADGGFEELRRVYLG